jgi:hypothetical protein
MHDPDKPACAPSKMGLRVLKKELLSENFISITFKSIPPAYHDRAFFEQGAAG